jgi:hypothetical protein
MEPRGLCFFAEYKCHFHDFLIRRGQNLMNFGEAFAQLLEPMAGVLISITAFITCAQLLPTPIKLTTRLSGSVRGAGIRCFIICYNVLYYNATDFKQLNVCRLGGSAG